jgi:hypothetical protein
MKLTQHFQGECCILRVLQDPLRVGSSSTYYAAPAPTLSSSTTAEVPVSWFTCYSPIVSNPVERVFQGSLPSHHTELTTTTVGNTAT